MRKKKTNIQIHDLTKHFRITPKEIADILGFKPSSIHCRTCHKVDFSVDEIVKIRNHIRHQESRLIDYLNGIIAVCTK